MNLTVEWVKHARELQPASFLGDTPGIPVIRVDALRAVIQELSDGYIGGMFKLPITDAIKRRDANPWGNSGYVKCLKKLLGSSLAKFNAGTPQRTK